MHHENSLFTCLILQEMKEWRLRLLILFSFLSILGLILIQAYWIRDAVEIKESHFSQTVNQAVTNAVWRIEHMAFRAEEKYREQSLMQGKREMLTLDSIHPDHSDGRMTPLMDGDTIMLGSLPESHTATNISDSLTIFQDQKDSLYAVLQDISRIIGSTDPGYANNQNEKDQLIYYNPKALEQSNSYFLTREFLEQILDDLSLIKSNKMAMSLIDSTLIVSVISDELTKEGIRLDFIHGIYFPFTGKLIHCDTINQKDNLLHSGFVYNLFPNFRLSKPVYLIIHFPGENKYLFSRLGLVLSISAGLILILIATFYYITRSIYRQKKLGEMKNDFINNMTHEFKTPVSTISLACEALRDNEVEKSPSMIDNYLQIITEENNRLGKLAENILQTAVIDKGHLFLFFEPVNLHLIITQIIEKYKPLTEQRGGIIQTKLLASDPFVTGDRTHLYNILSNLVDNAIKYCIIKPEIEIITKDNEASLTFSIKDNGIGISKSHQKRIFEKLYRVPTGNVHDVKGFGLGLSYVKYIVGRHLGQIRVESELHKGSLFMITLPRRPDKQA